MEPIRRRLVRLPEVLAIVGVSKSTLYAWVENGLFPAPVRLGPRAVAWRACDVARWLESRPSARSSQVDVEVTS